MSQQIKHLNEENVRTILKWINLSASIDKSIDDLNIRTDAVFSSKKVSELTQDVKDSLEQYIQSSINGLTHLKKKIVDTLPSDADAEENILYLVKDTSVVDDVVYNQYLLIDGALEPLGNTSTDMSNYYNKDQSDAKFALLYNLQTLIDMVGNASDLETTAKDTLVSAINEIKEGLDNCITKENIATTIDSTVTDSQVPSALGTKTYIDGLFNQIDLTTYYTKTEIDNDFLKKVDADGKYATITTVDGKANTSDLTTHTRDTDIHITSAERTKWNKVTDKLDTVDFNTHKNNTDIHITSAERTKWNKVTDKLDTVDFNTHKNNTDIHITKKEKDKLVTTDNITDTIDINSSGTKIPNVKAVYNDIIIGKDINQTVIDTYGTEILKYPLGIWRFGTVGTANKFADLPVKTGGRIEITSIKADTNSNPWNSSWAYRVYNFETFTGMNYCRKVTSTDKPGIGSDTGWQKVCTTTVADVGVTTITPVNSAITGTIEYTVKNGICYVSMKDLMSTISSTGLSISTTMPKPPVNYNAVSVSSSGNVARIYIDKNTTKLNGDFYEKNVKSNCSFSYPVAE